MVPWTGVWKAADDECVEVFDGGACSSEGSVRTKGTVWVVKNVEDRWLAHVGKNPLTQI